MQISGGSTHSAEEGARFFFFFLACPADFSSFCDSFLTQRAPRASPLDPSMQMDKYKEITGFDVYCQTLMIYIMSGAHHIMFTNM